MVNNSFQTAVAVQSHHPHVESTVSESVVEAVADEQGISTSEVRPPLYDAIDPDALDDLFARSSPGMDGHVVFPYCGYEITVYSDGHVSIIEQSNGE